MSGVLGDFNNESMSHHTAEWRQAPQHSARALRTAFCAASVVGPPSEGIQKKPSVSSPSSATFDNALHADKRVCHEHQHHMCGSVLQVVALRCMQQALHVKDAHVTCTVQ